MYFYLCKVLILDLINFEKYFQNKSEELHMVGKVLHMVGKVYVVFSSPGQSPGRAIVLSPASALASALVLAASALAKC